LGFCKSLVVRVFGYLLFDFLALYSASLFCVSSSSSLSLSPNRSSPKSLSSSLAAAAAPAEPYAVSALATPGKLITG